MRGVKYDERSWVQWEELSTMREVDYKKESWVQKGDVVGETEK